MPRTIPIAPAMATLVAAQDGVITREQLQVHGLDSGYVYRQVTRGRWQRLLPGIILTNTGAPTRRQLVLAAWLWAGPGSAIDGVSACAWYGLQAAEFRADVVHLAVPVERGVRSRDFVVVRRACAQIEVGDHARVPYVDRASAVIVAARSCRSEHSAVALLSQALQRELVTVASLAEARERIGDKWCHRVDAALLAVGVGVRSPAERDNRDLILSSRVLPEPKWNQWLDLGDGLPPVCADALWEDAGMVEEVNGRRYHAWGEQFETTEARRARIVAADLVAQGVTPIQLRRTRAQVLARLERTYLRTRGRGMPPGVTLIAAPQLRADGARSASARN